MPSSAYCYAACYHAAVCWCVLPPYARTAPIILPLLVDLIYTFCSLRALTRTTYRNVAAALVAAGATFAPPYAYPSFLRNVYYQDVLLLPIFVRVFGLLPLRPTTGVCAFPTAHAGVTLPPPFPLLHTKYLR